MGRKTKMWAFTQAVDRQFSVRDLRRELEAIVPNGYAFDIINRWDGVRWQHVILKDKETATLVSLFLYPDGGFNPHPVYADYAAAIRTRIALPWERRRKAS